jgi:hypothetical protein
MRAAIQFQKHETERRHDIRRMIVVSHFYKNIIHICIKATSHKGSHCVACQMERKIKLFTCAEFILRLIYYKTPKSNVLLGKIFLKYVIINSKFLKINFKFGLTPQYGALLMTGYYH